MSISFIHLTLFLTRAVPLSLWDQLGLLEREIVLYRRLCPHLTAFSIVTDGGAEELDYQEKLPGVRILYNRWGLSPNLYSLLAPFLHWQTLQKATIYKTNQLDGAWTAIIAGLLHHRPVIVRAGYGWALNFRRSRGDTRKARLIRRLERWMLRRANRVAITTPRLRQYIVQEHGVPAERVAVIPNYVDTEGFCPLPNVQPGNGRVVFVGTFNSAKNLPALLQAAAQVPAMQLTLIGDGPLRPQLETLAQDLDIVERVTFAGRVNHAQLPNALNQAQVFALVSHYEGHPKALIEAMACGRAVVGTDVDGIQDVIRHEETGLLCDPTPEGIAAALARLLEDNALRNSLGQAARKFAVREYSLERIVEQELTLLDEMEGK